MPELFFLRPWWLAAIPIVPLLVWRLRRYLDAGERWQTVCDEHLLAHLLVGHGATDARWPLRLIAVGLVLACVALAGPAWRQVELPVYRAPVARVVVLDLSRSMNAPDLKPSRLARARFKVADILRRETAEQTGLVVFAGDAFVVSPLTHDAETLIAMLPALETSVMPLHGSRVDLGLRAAGRLLRQGRASRGEVILVTDAAREPGAPAAAAKLAEDGFPVSVLAVGTPEGAPIPLPAGDFLKDESGSIVVPGLSLEALGAIARAGGGRLVAMTADDRDLERLLSTDLAIPWGEEARSTDRSTALWRDEGPWLVLILLPLAALGFRRGWLMGILVVALMEPPAAKAFEWDDLWWRADQRTARAIARGRPDVATRLAPNPAWRGAAEYRAERYEDAARSFGGLSDPDSDYNRGNALARGGHLREALRAYEAALDRDPGLGDAAYNHALVERLLREQPPRSGGQGRGSESSGSNPDRGTGSRDDSPRSGDGADGSRDEARDGLARGEDDSLTRADPSQEHDESGARELPSSAEPGREEPPPQRTDPSAEDVGENAQASVDGAMAEMRPEPDEERRQALEQWLRRIPDDPGGLLRRKFALEYQRRGRPRGEQTQSW